MATGPGSLLIEVADRATDIDSVMSAVTESTRNWIGVGPVFLATTDPLTGAFSDTFTFDIPPEAAAAFFQIEMSGRDVATFQAIGRSEAGMAALVSSTDGHPERSERWREVIEPLHWGDEIRAVVRANGHTWGYICLHREANDDAFGDRDHRRLAALLPAIATAMRVAAHRTAGERDPLDTGVILTDELGRVLDVTGAAVSWLAELGQPRPSGLPLLLEGICRCAGSDGTPITTSLTTRTGRVALVEVAQLQATGEPRIALVIRAAPAAYTLDRFASAVSLTAREREIVLCVLRGLSTKHIADELSISARTVQAHLTAVFAKTGMNSRRELVTRLRR